jgi:hypothetical protein
VAVEKIAKKNSKVGNVWIILMNMPIPEIPDMTNFLERDNTSISK